MEINNDSSKKPSEEKPADKEISLKNPNDKPSNRAYLYQPFRKSTTNKDRLKPLVQNFKIIQ
jgi:hypothetical protein